MASEKMEQVHGNISKEDKEWMIGNKENHDCDSINSFLRFIIRDFKRRSENGEMNKLRQSPNIYTYSIWAVFLPLFLFVAGRLNDNDPLLFSLGIVSLSGIVIVIMTIRKKGGF